MYRYLTLRYFHYFKSTATVSLKNLRYKNSLKIGRDNLNCSVVLL